MWGCDLNGSRVQMVVPHRLCKRRLRKRTRSHMQLLLACSRCLQQMRIALFRLCFCVRDHDALITPLGRHKPCLASSKHTVPFPSLARSLFVRGIPHIQTSTVNSFRRQLTDTVTHMQRSKNEPTCTAIATPPTCAVRDLGS